MANDIIAYRSKLDKNFSVYILYPEDGELYMKMKKVIPSGDIAFTNLNQKIIMIDGKQLNKLSKDHLFFIEAHEIAHHRLKHKSTHGNATQELEADYGAYLLLAQFGLKNAMDLVKKYWTTRHRGISFTEYQQTHHSSIARRMKIDPNIINFS